MLTAFELPGSLLASPCYLMKADCLVFQTRNKYLHGAMQFIFLLWLCPIENAVFSVVLSQEHLRTIPIIKQNNISL